MSSSPATPVSRFRELSLGSGSMPPTTRSQARRQSVDTNTDYDDSGPERESDSGRALSDEDEDDDEDDDDSPIVCSPSNLTYRVDRLSPKGRKRVRSAFKNPPQLSLEFCTRHENAYAFHMTEAVPRSIRIGTRDSPYAIPWCSCTGTRPQNKPPCKHLVWFLDQLVKQTLYGHDPNSPLTMTPYGYPEEMGNLFADVSNFHLDVLADGLHCDVENPIFREETEHSDSGLESDSESEPYSPNPHRVQEIREILSSVDSSPTDEFRPDLFSSPAAAAAGSKREPVWRGDLEGTIFRMLLANNEFFHYFLSRMPAGDPVNDRFRKLSQRVDRVLRELDAYAAGSTRPSSSYPAAAADEPPRDVAWAARHLLGVVGLVRTAIHKRGELGPMERWEQASAARLLVHVLASVVERNRDFIPPSTPASAAPAIPRRDRNLYLRLVGDGGGDDGEAFVLDVLLKLPPDVTAPYLHVLEAVEEQLGVSGAPASYVAKFRSLVDGLRRAGAPPPSSSSSAGSKRQSQGPHDRGSKRMR